MIIIIDLSAVADTKKADQLFTELNSAPHPFVRLTLVADTNPSDDTLSGSIWEGIIKAIIDHSGTAMAGIALTGAISITKTLIDKMYDQTKIKATIEDGYVKQFEGTEDVLYRLMEHLEQVRDESAHE